MPALPSAPQLGPYLNAQIFHAAGTSSVAGVGAWQFWKKPANATWVLMICIGSGASGAGGATRAAGAASIGAGGGGGGCSGYTTLLIPAALLPDTLFISVGVGPAGGVGNAAGVIGNNSYISAILANITGANLYLKANTNNPAAPAAASTTGAAGAAGTITAITGCQLAYGGIFSATVSVPGGAGSLGAGAAAAVVAMTSSFLCGGTGGGGVPTSSNVDTAGGPITAAGLVPALVGGLAAGGNGLLGFFQLNGLCGSGGTGGGSNGAAGTGGVGGNGGIGCGGGGGGEGVTGGAGGRAGDGLVAIFCM